MWILPCRVPRRLWEFGAVTIDGLLSGWRRDRIAVWAVANNITCVEGVSTFASALMGWVLRERRVKRRASPCLRCSSILSHSNPPFLTRHRYHKSVNLAKVGPGTLRSGEKYDLRNGKKIRAMSATTAAPARTSTCILYTLADGKTNAARRYHMVALFM